MSVVLKMFESEDVMDFKAEEKRTQLSHFHSEDTGSDCSTLSASEVNSYDGNCATVPPFYKLKKARVLIKKLPRDVLEKYKISCKEPPLRSSGRIRGKHIPVGKYLALHKNKPLDKVVKRKKIWGTNIVKVIQKNKHESQKSMTNILPGYSSFKRALKSRNVSSDSSSKSKDVATSECIPDSSYSLHSRKPACSKFESKNGKNDYNIKPSCITTTRAADKRNKTPSYNSPTLQERKASTTVVHKPSETSLPKLPDVVITRYDISPTSTSYFALNEAQVPKPVRNSMGSKTEQNKKTSKPYTNSYPKLYCPANVQSKVFPAFITPAPSVNQSRHLMPSNATPKNSNKGFQRHSLPAQRKFTIQAFKIPNNSSTKNDPVPVTSPRVFIVNQSSLGIDPLNTPKSEAKTTKHPERQFGKENTTGNAIEVCDRCDSDVEKIDAEKQIEPEVIKRIIYHTKSVQTKFTCNSSICGLVDSDEFNLNCFYCYEIFPLHKWSEFKDHIKVVHQIEESANQTDSEIDSDNSHFQNRQENCSLNPSSTPRHINENDKQNFIAKAVTNTQQVYKKLPLEPRLLAQRQNKMITEQSILVSSTSKTVKPSKITHQSGKSIKSIKFNNKRIDEIISLDSDDCELQIEDIYGLNKTPKVDLQAAGANKKEQSDNKFEENNVQKIVLPSLPHITIKKVAKATPKVNIVARKIASEPTPNETFIKIPSTASIQKVIKTLPKPTANQLCPDGKTRPRYFVVKKIIKLPTTDKASKASDVNIPKGTILTKMLLDSKNSNMKSLGKLPTDNMEDSVPKPTSGLGILFGLTNSMVVIEFLLKLKTFPELWRCQLKNSDPVKCNESVRKLCSHLNNRFSLNMTEFEMLLSIQRVKDWYYLMLQSIQEHNKDPNNKAPYKHRFPIYFKILSQYLTPDADEKGVRLNEIINKTALAAKASAANLNEKSPVDANETGTKSLIQSFNNTQPSNTSATTQSIAPSSHDNSENQEVTADSLIEFDADTLYDQESSEEEIIEEFDESMFFNKISNKEPIKADGTRRRTKVYLGSFECDICHKVYKRSCDLKRHRVLHLPPQFECGRCSQKFYFKHRAERCNHVKYKYKKVDKASGEKRIWPKKIFRFNMICEICGNSYRSIGSLNTHKRDKHFNQRNTCIVCNFTALSNWRIVQHQRKRHIVEPGLPEDVAKKSRARTESKTSFSNEARQAFDWRREMRKKLKPGEKFYGCCRCKIIFNTRKEKVLHNKIEHPITEYTVICLLCLPNKLLLSNSNCARRHYTDIHKVPWHEIDGLVKCTKPIFNLLSKEEIELLKASENYKELLDELLKDKKLQWAENVHIVDSEASEAVQNLPHLKELDGESTKIEEEYTQDQDVYVDSITDNDHSNKSNYKHLVHTSINEHNYSEEYEVNESFDVFGRLIDNPGEELYSQKACEEGTVLMDAALESIDCRMENYIQNDQEYVQNTVGDFVEDELIEESIVVEEYIDEVIGEDEEELF